MDSWLIEQLEERLTGFQDTDSMKLNEFEDFDLAMYPAIEIPQIKLTADQCETIANNLIKMISTGDKDLIFQAARAMAVLAYNALMEAPYNHDNAVPFFHKYNADEYAEDWLRTSGTSDVDLEALSHRKLQDIDDQDGLALEMIYSRASDFERKSSIGAWAFSHLKALWRNKTINFMDSHSHNERETFIGLFGFRCAYRFPYIGSDLPLPFINVCTINQPGEMMYLFYRSAIILEKIRRHPRMQIQKAILVKFAFGGRGGLRYGGQQLRNLLRAASKMLNISEKQLLDDLDWALKDPRWVKYSASSLKTLQLLREFRRKFEQGSSNWGASRYYKYARLVNYYYFYYLGSKSSKELESALRKLSSGWMELRNDSPYEKWGQLIAQKILEFRSLE